MGNICHICPTRPIVDLVLSEEEGCFIRSEFSLAFRRHPVLKLAQAFRTNSNKQKLKDSQLKTVVTELSLNITDIDSVGSPIYNFYKNFTTYSSKYDLTKLLVLAAVLGAGCTTERVTVLFELLPDLEEGMATPPSVDWLVDEVFTLSAEILPQLAAAQERCWISLSAEELKTYMTRLYKNLALAKPAATRLIMKERERVSSQDLLSALNGGGPLGKILRPLEARRFILQDEFRRK